MKSTSSKPSGDGQDRAITVTVFDGPLDAIPGGVSTDLDGRPAQVWSNDTFVNVRVQSDGRWFDIEAVLRAFGRSA